MAKTTQKFFKIFSRYEVKQMLKLFEKKSRFDLLSVTFELTGNKTSRGTKQIEMTNKEVV